MNWCIYPNHPKKTSNSRLVPTRIFPDLIQGWTSPGHRMGALRQVRVEVELDDWTGASCKRLDKPPVKWVGNWRWEKYGLLVVHQCGLSFLDLGKNWKELLPHWVSPVKFQRFGCACRKGPFRYIGQLIFIGQLVFSMDISIARCVYKPTYK